jgi:16S rRNA (uracil1498-N3)-methyltransferase
MHRFYAPALREDDETASLEEDDALHLVRVLRLVPGTDVRIFNGAGLERIARVELADKRGVVLRVLDRVEPAPELPFPLTLAQSVLKGDAMEDVVRDAVMLGVTRVVPVLTTRSESSRAQLERTHRLDRWHRVAISSAKQCGRAVVPSVGSVQSLNEVLGDGPGERYVLVEPRATASVVAARELRPGAPAEGAVVVAGPEGGWTPEELRLCDASHARLVTLGTLTLRADAAARVALPVLRFIWGAL